VPQAAQLIAAGGAERSDAPAAAVTGASAAINVPAARALMVRRRVGRSRPARRLQHARGTDRD